MNEVLKYLQDRYAETGFKYFGFIELRNKFGQSVRESLNELYKKGYILKHEGANAPVIELKDESKINI